MVMAGPRANLLFLLQTVLKKIKLIIGSSFLREAISSSVNRPAQEESKHRKSAGEAEGRSKEQDAMLQ